MTPKKKPPRPHPGSGRRPTREVKVPRQRTKPQIRYVGAPKQEPKPAPKPKPAPPAAATPQAEPAPSPRPQAEPAPAVLQPRPPPLPPSLAPRPHRQRDARRAVVAGVVVLLVVAAVTGWRLMGAGDDPGSSTPEPGERTPRPPVAVAAGTSYVESRVTGSGDLRVRHWIHTRADLFGLELVAPRASGGVPTSARARDVRVVVDGSVVDGPESVGTTTVFYTFAGTRRVFVSYRLEGAVTESPSEPGRGLARVTSLSVTYTPRPTSSTRRVVGADVLAMACAAPGSDVAAVPVPCGAPKGKGWEVELSGPDVDNRVAAQFDRR